MSWICNSSLVTQSALPFGQQCVMLLQYALAIEELKSASFTLVSGEPDFSSSELLHALTAKSANPSSAPHRNEDRTHDTIGQ
jgi:hypothetical protein